MTNMAGMAVYGKTLKNLLLQKHGIETAFYKSILDIYTISFVQMI